MNYFEFHVGDWVKATRHLSCAEEGVYLRLVLRYYEDERPLPAELSKVQRLAGARTRDERAAVASVLEEFFVLESDGYRHRRCDEVLAAYFSFCEAQSNKARLGAAAKWSAKSRGDAAQRAASGHAAGTPDDARSMPGASPDDAPAMPFPSSHSPSPTTHDGSIEPSSQRGEKRKGPKTSGARRSNRVPDSFAVTPELRSWAAEHTPRVDLERETAAMRDYEFRRPYSDWPAVWRRWMARAAEQQGAISNGRRKTRFEQADDALERWREEQRRQGGGFLEGDEGALRLPLDGSARGDSLAAVDAGDRDDDAGGGEARAPLAAHQR